MEIKCNLNPNYLSTYPSPQKERGVTFSGRYRIPHKSVGKSVDIFVKRPDEAQNAAGLLSIKPQIVENKPKTIFGAIKGYARQYVKNIQHTYEHKVVYALVEKELFGRNTIDSITHDADKMILYLLGFPKSFVSKYHRMHSCHHAESGKRMNIRSMLCDNIASSPEFKPEKKMSVRKFFNSNEELQHVRGLRELMEKYNYGENLNFARINAEKDARYTGLKGISLVCAKLMMLSPL